MKTILIINDNSAAATHAAQFAFVLAQHCNANIVLANTIVNKNKVLGKLLQGYNGEANVAEDESSSIVQHLLGISDPGIDFLPEIKEIDISNANECALAEFINRNKVWMMVKGISAANMAAHEGQKPKVHIVLNKIACPLLLIPENWPLKMIERMTYISDLRYCRIEIVRYLAELAGGCRADLSFAHLTAKGLPDMDDAYALNMFTDEICRKVKYDQFFFNKIKEKDFTTAIDVMVNGMENDVLAFVNHHFHIEDILGGFETKMCSAPITVPVLIFPY